MVYVLHAIPIRSACLPQQVMQRLLKTLARDLTQAEPAVQSLAADSQVRN